MSKAKSLIEVATPEQVRRVTKNAGALQTASITKSTKGNGQKAQMPAVFPWPLGDLIVPTAGCGLGDPWSPNNKNMGEPWRDQIGYWVFIRDAVTGNLVLGPNSTFTYFQSGDNEPPPASTPLPTFQQFNGSTNLFAGGAPVYRDQLFAAVAVGFSVGRPFALSASGGGPYLAERHFPAWLDPYADRMRDLVFSNMGISFQFRDAACNFELGSPEFYPMHAGQFGGPTVRPGGGFGVMGMLPILRGPIYMGGVDEQNQAQIIAQSSQESITVEQDPMVATTADVAVPVRFVAYGDFGSWCGPCAPSEQDIDAVVMKRLAALIGSGQITQAQLAAAAATK